LFRQQISVGLNPPNSLKQANPYPYTGYSIEGQLNTYVYIRPMAGVLF